MKTLALALRSAWNRRLTLAAVALSALLLLGVERLRSELRASFAMSVSGVDLVVGARGSPVQLMLYSVFRMGEATQNPSWASVEWLARQPTVAWTVPLALGDSHRGFPVLGTTPEYFERFRYGDRQPLQLAQGRPFTTLFEAVLGAEAVGRPGDRLGEKITLAHGSGEGPATEHADKPFAITGILARTGTPVDRSVRLSLESPEALHLDLAGGAPMPGLSMPPPLVRRFDLKPKALTAVQVGLENRAAVFSLQRSVNGYDREARMGVLPGVALDELGQLVAVAERCTQLVSMTVVVVGLAGLVAVILAGLNERRRELAILRSVGAHPRDVFALLAIEGCAVAVLGALLGAVLSPGASGRRRAVAAVPLRPRARRRAAGRRRVAAAGRHRRRRRRGEPAAGLARVSSFTGRRHDAAALIRPGYRCID
jgi:putative ABC transport system permease protein